jgi:hypothetical protein
MTPELLWKAWPSGYLSMRGIGTVGGWTYCGEGWWLPGGEADIAVHEGMDGFHEAAREGQLLPKVDPDDAATWGCLLEDLAEAAGGTWSGRDLSWRREGRFWVLFGVTVFGPGEVEVDRWRQFTGIDTDDPGEALVQARIQLRPRGGR